VREFVRQPGGPVVQRRLQRYRGGSDEMYGGSYFDA
jgi:hypothetical protein